MPLHIAARRDPESNITNTGRRATIAAIMANAANAAAMDIATTTVS
jgi:hypothetical protein